VLNRAGYDIPRNYKDSKATASSIETGSGADGKWYFYRYSAIVPYLKQEYGEPLSFDPGRLETIEGLRGIIAFSGCNSQVFTGHITLWDGQNCADYCMRCAKGMLWVLP